MIYEDLTDEKLVSLAQDDELALDELLIRFSKLVVSRSRRFFILGGEKEDLVQEGNIGLFFAIKNFENDKNTKFSTFATYCIDRAMMKAVEKASSYKNRPLNDSLSYDTADGNDFESENAFFCIQQNEKYTINPESIIIEAQENSETIREIFNSLSDFERKVFNGYYMGFDYREIAFSLNVTEKSVDNALSRIKKKAKKVKENIK